MGAPVHVVEIDPVEIEIAKSSVQVVRASNWSSRFHASKLRHGGSRHGGHHGFAFFLQDAFNVSIFAAFTRGNLNKTDWHISGKPTQEFLGASSDPVRHFVTHSNDLNSHGLLLLRQGTG